MLRYIFLVILLSFVGGWYLLRLDLDPTFIEGVVGQPVDLIPGLGSRNPVDEILEELLFRPLFTYDREGKIVHDLAESYTTYKNGEIYDITLKKSYWLDGTAITVADVTFTFTREPAFSKITIEQEGERRVRFVLENPLSSFLDILTKPIAPAHFREIPLDSLGSGDFYITDVEKEGGRISELRLQSKKSGAIKNLVFKFFPDEESLREAAMQGEVDSVSDVSFSSEYFTLYERPMPNRYFALFFNLGADNPLAKDVKFRAAASKKTPLASGGLVKGPMSGTWAQAKLSFPRFTSKSAKKFKGSISITVPKTNGVANIAKGIASTWEEELGIDVKVKEVSASQLERVLEERDFEAIILGQEVNRDPDRYNLWHSSQREYPGQNIAGYADPRADRALEEGRATLARSARKTHYTNFQRLFIEDNPVVFLDHPNFNWWVNSKFAGPDLTPIFSPVERFWNFSDWTRN